jgi:hypothetical protein
MLKSADLNLHSPYVKWDTPTTVKLDKVPLYTKETFLQLIKELRPAIKPLEGMGKGKTTSEWFDILVKDIEEKL